MTPRRNYKATVVATSVSATEIAPLDDDRNALVLFNAGTVDVFIGLTSDLVNIRIPVGTHLAFEPGICPLNAVFAASPSGTGSITVWSA